MTENEQTQNHQRIISHADKNSLNTQVQKAPKTTVFDTIWSFKQQGYFEGQPTGGRQRIVCTNKLNIIREKNQ